LLDDWVQELSKELSIEGDTDVKELLDVARVVAHKVERRAAPVTTYLMGLAVAERGGESLPGIARAVVERARRWEGPAPGDA
jgi:hypothetical protein